ncbi:MAG: GNAT family N-acetyltransferase [Chloroflexi bacterium]|nr:GNAT family N-acetyltransferase [Chloroflexota bacterium]MCY3695819.1 GNAT family N-acetyltransferase [Chloroflexota bacterium]
MTYQIKSVGHDACPEVIELIHRVFDEYGFIWDPEDEFWDLLSEEHAFPYRSPIGAFWVMRDKSDAVVGSIAANRIDGPTVELHRLYLDAHLRGQGLGRRLFETAVAWAREHGAGRIELWSDTRFEDAHRLYERLGYVKSDTRKLNDVNQTVEFKYERDLSDST